MPEMSGNSTQSDQIPLEIYLEGNVVFRQGSRVIYARSMFYNVRANNGTILEAEALTPLPQVYEGLVRLKADVLQQLDKNQFQAYGRIGHVQPTRVPAILASIGKHLFPPRAKATGQSLHWRGGCRSDRNGHSRQRPPGSQSQQFIVFVWTTCFLLAHPSSLT